MICHDFQWQNYPVDAVCRKKRHKPVWFISQHLFQATATWQMCERTDFSTCTCCWPGGPVLVNATSGTIAIIYRVFHAIVAIVERSTAPHLLLTFSEMLNIGPSVSEMLNIGPSVSDPHLATDCFWNESVWTHSVAFFHITTTCWSQCNGAKNHN